jgi:hypothetical protein
MGLKPELVAKAVPVLTGFVTKLERSERRRLLASVLN